MKPPAKRGSAATAAKRAAPEPPKRRRVPKTLEPAPVAGTTPREPDAEPVTERLNQQQVRGAPGVQTVFGWDVESVSDALRTHSRGNFSRSGVLLDDMASNVVIGHGLETRQQAWRTLPRRVEPGKGENARRCADFVREVLPDILPDGTLDDWLKHELFMGGSTSAMDWEVRTDGKDTWWLPLVKPWHPSQLYYQYSPERAPRAIDGQALIANTRERGPVLVEPGWGRWVHIARGTLAPWLNGLVRALGEPYLGDTYTLRDALALGERFGQGVVKLFHPTEWNAEQIGNSVETVRSSGRGGVISCPQTVDGKKRVDVEMLKIDAAGADVFEKTEDRLVRRFLVCLLGQNMTTVGQTGGFAQAAIHSEVLWHKRERDAATFGDARLVVERDERGALRKLWRPYSGPIRQQITRWIAYFNFGSFAAAPFVYWDATPPEDIAAKEIAALDAAVKKASAAKTLADALKILITEMSLEGIDPWLVFEQLGLALRRPPAEPESEAPDATEVAA